MSMQSILPILVALGEGAVAAMAIKATGVVLAALLLLRLTGRASASLRHLVAATTFGVLLLLPLASSLASPRLVRIDVPAPARAFTRAPVATGTAMPSERSPIGAPPPRTTVSLGRVASGMYLGGVVLFAATLFAGLWRVRRMRGRAEVSVAGTQKANEMARAMGRPGGVEVLVSPDLAVPITVGFGRGAILLPASTSEWSDDERQRALRHELEHIARGDWATQVLARFACAVYWPHPLVWALWSRLRLEAERACDDAVLRGHAGEPEPYAEQLVALARRLVGKGSVPGLAMATRGSLGIRVEAILDRRLPRRPQTRGGSIGVAAAALTGLLVLAPFRLMSAPVTANEASLAPDDHEADELDVALMSAAEKGDTQRMNRLIERGARADAVIPGDGSPLIAAARRGQVAALEMLIDAGADVNRGVSGDGNALTNAARKGHLEAVRLLLARGAEIDRGVPGDGNALIMAAGDGQLEVVRFLLDNRAGIEVVVPGDENALIHACESGQDEVVRLLIARGSDVNARVWSGSSDEGRVRGEWRTPLVMATRGHHDAVVAILRAAGARD